jgi:uncharacterized C2H2 Zn-finger protein
LHRVENVSTSRVNLGDSDRRGLKNRMMYSEEHKALVCTGYGNRQHKVRALKEGSVTNKDGTVETFLSCPKCYQTHPYPDSLRKSLERMNLVLEDEKKLREQPPVDPSKVAETVADTLIPHQEGGENEQAKAGSAS